MIPTTGGSLTFTTTTTTTVSFPADSFSEPVTVTYSLSETTDVGAAFKAIGSSFVIEALDQSGNPVNSVSQYFTITVSYGEADVVGVDEASLKIYYWDTNTSQWIALPTAVDTESHVLTATPNSLGKFAILGEMSMPTATPYRLYLPIVFDGFAAGP